MAKAHDFNCYSILFIIQYYFLEQDLFLFFKWAGNIWKFLPVIVIFLSLQGTKVMQMFMWYLNPRQVFDLSQEGPKDA